MRRAKRREGIVMDREREEIGDWRLEIGELEN